MPQRTGRKQVISRRQHQILARRHALNLHQTRSKFQMLIISAQQLQPQQLPIPRHQTLNLIKYRRWIERAQPRLKMIRGKPDRVPIRLT